MKMKKAVLITFVVAILTVVSFSSAAAMSVKYMCNLYFAADGGVYDEVNNTCVFDTQWAEVWCLEDTGRRNQVYVMGINKAGQWWGACVSRTVTAEDGGSIDLYSGMCGAYISNSPPGGVSLWKIPNKAALHDWGWTDVVDTNRKLLADPCQLRYAEGYEVYAQVYFNLTEVNRGRFDRGEMALVIWNGSTWEDCGGYLVEGGEFGRVACGTTATIFGIMRQ